MNQSISLYRIFGATVSTIGGILGCAISTLASHNGWEMAGVMVVALTAYILFSSEDFDNDDIAAIIGFISGFGYLVVGCVAAFAENPYIVWAYLPILLLVKLHVTDLSEW